MPRIDQSLIDSTFFLYKTELSARQGGDAQGTGFVVAHRVRRFPEHSDAIDFTHYYAVTNSHVARIAPVVRLNRKGATEVFPFDESEWAYHPNGDEIAAIHLGAQLDEGWCDRPAISSGLFDLGYSDQIGVGDDVFMIGLFVDHEGKETNNPMARFGNISMIANENSRIVHGNRRLLSHVVDMHSRSGFSGSPVFVYRTFGSDLSHRSLESQQVRVKLRSPRIPSTNRWRPARRQGWSLSDTSETFDAAVQTNPLFRVLGIHWGQFRERWGVRRMAEAVVLVGESKANDANDHYIDGVSGMTLVSPAAKILELLELSTLETKRLEAERELPPYRTAE